jgi:hypothetical protein
MDAEDAKEEPQHINNTDIAMAHLYRFFYFVVLSRSRRMRTQAHFSWFWRMGSFFRLVSRRSATIRTGK